MSASKSDAAVEHEVEQLGSPTVPDLIIPVFVLSEEFLKYLPTI